MAKESNYRARCGQDDKGGSDEFLFNWRWSRKYNAVTFAWVGDFCLEATGSNRDYRAMVRYDAFGSHREITDGIVVKTSQKSYDTRIKAQTATEKMLEGMVTTASDLIKKAKGKR